MGSTVESYDWQRLDVQRNAGIITIALNRPDKRNAFDFITFQELDRVSRWLKQDRTLRGVILTSTGSHFSSGLDIHDIITSRNKAIKLLAKVWPMKANLAQRVVTNWHALPVPVVAVIHGHCLGGAMQLALGADLRFVCNDAHFSIMEVQWGLLPDMGGLLNLRDTLGIDQAMRLSMSGELLDARRALEIGLVTWVGTDPRQEANEWLAQVSNRSPDAVAAIKRSYYKSWHTSRSFLLWRETLLQLKLLAGKNFKIAGKRQRKQKEIPYVPRDRW